MKFATSDPNVILTVKKFSNSSESVALFDLYDYSTGGSKVSSNMPFEELHSLADWIKENIPVRTIADEVRGLKPYERFTVQGREFVKLEGDDVMAPDGGAYRLYRGYNETGNFPHWEHVSSTDFKKL